MKDIRIFPDGCLMRFVIIDEHGEIFPRRIEFKSAHPEQRFRVETIVRHVQCPRWREMPLSGRNILPQFGVN